MGDELTPGQVAYDAWRKSTLVRLGEVADDHSGCPAWSHLAASQMEAWEAGAKAVLDYDGPAAPLTMEGS